MDDFIAALLCLPFIIPPSVVLVAIILSKLRAFAGDKAYCLLSFFIEGPEAHSQFIRSGDRPA